MQRQLNPLAPRAERQSARVSKITNDDLTQYGTGCFIAVPNYPYGNSGRQRVNNAVTDPL